MLESLYTDKVQNLMYETKKRLPNDFPLVTVEKEIYDELGYDTIVIQVQAEHYDWRTVEDRLAIAITLERLKELIREEGIPCLIEKPGHAPSG